MLSETKFLREEEFREWKGRDDDVWNRSNREDRVG